MALSLHLLMPMLVLMLVLVPILILNLVPKPMLKLMLSTPAEADDEDPASIAGH